MPEAERQALYQGHQAYLTDRAEREAEKEAARALEKAERSKRRHDASPDRDGHKVRRGQLLKLSMHWRAERCTRRHSASPHIPATGRVCDRCGAGPPFGPAAEVQVVLLRCTDLSPGSEVQFCWSSLVLTSDPYRSASPSARVRSLSVDTRCRSPDPCVRAHGCFLSTGCKNAL